MNPMPLILTSAILFLAACASVDPQAIRVVYDQPITRDAIYVYPDTPGPVLGKPGEKITLGFRIANGVRDELFLQWDEATAMVTSVVTRSADRPEATQGRFEGLQVPPPTSPAASEPNYRHLLRTPRTAQAPRPGMIAPDAALPVRLTLDLPGGDWQEAHITLTFHAHGYLRSTGAEFRAVAAHTLVVRRGPAASASHDPGLVR